MTATLGLFCLMRRVAWMPSMPGSTMSISTTSGSRWATRSSAASAESASATTSMSASRLRTALRPSRMRKWSSQTRMRMGSIETSAMGRLLLADRRGKRLERRGEGGRRRVGHAGADLADPRLAVRDGRVDERRDTCFHDLAHVDAHRRALPAQRGQQEDLVLGQRDLARELRLLLARPRVAEAQERDERRG